MVCPGGIPHTRGLVNTRGCAGDFFAETPPGVQSIGSLLNDPSPIGGAAALTLVLAVAVLGLALGAWLVVRIGNPTDSSPPRTR